MRVIPLFLIPALLFCQTADLSDAAKTLATKPKSGYAELKLKDGSKIRGGVLRINGNSVTLQTPVSCKEIGLSKITAVHWIHDLPRVTPDPVETTIYLTFFALIFGPILGYSALVERFKSTPVNPPSGNWDSAGGFHEGFHASLAFNGNAVYARFTIRKHGKYSVLQNRLHITFEGQPETVTAFHFNCTQLVIDTLGGFDLSTTSHADTPLVGTWYGYQSTLKLTRDGNVEEEKQMAPFGTVNRTPTGVTIHWLERDVPGGQDWSLQIRHRCLLLRLGKNLMKFHYAG
jgi:hypothetical protein